MIRKLDHQNMGRSNLGWLQSLFHFSFADYYNPANMNFGVLRVVNTAISASTGKRGTTSGSRSFPAPKARHR